MNDQEKNPVSQEMLEKAKAARSAEELRALAKENDVELSEEEAAAYFSRLHSSGELSDEELDNVAGGGGCKPQALARKTNDLKVGDVIRAYVPMLGSYVSCSCGNDYYRVTGLIPESSQNLFDAACTKCGRVKRFTNYDEQDVFHKIIL